MNTEELSREKQEVVIDTSFLIDISAGTHLDEKQKSKSPKIYTGDRLPLPANEYNQTEVEQIYEAIERQNEEMAEMESQQCKLLEARVMQRDCSHDGCTRRFNHKCTASGGPFCRGHCISRQVDATEQKTVCRVHRKAHELAGIHLYQDPIARAYPIFPWSLRTLWRILRAKVRFTQKLFPHPCTIHKGHSMLVENLQRLETVIKDLLQTETRTNEDTLRLKRLLFTRHSLRRKYKLALIHFVHDACSRQYVQEYRRKQTRFQATVVRDFGSRYNEYGQKSNICCFGIGYKDVDGASKMWFLANICSVPAEQKEDWGFYKTALEFHFRRMRLSGRGFLRKFTEFLLTGDRGPHFICHRSVYFESTLPSAYDVKVSTSTYCPKHSYNENDGLFGSLNSAFNALEAQGRVLRTNADYCLAFMEMKKTGKFANVEMWPFDKIDRSEVFYQARKINYSIKLRSTFIYSTLDEDDREVSIPGVFRTSFLPNETRPVVIDMRKLRCATDLR